MTKRYAVRRKRFLLSSILLSISFAFIALLAGLRHWEPVSIILESSARLLAMTGRYIEVRLDKAPPTAPRNLTGGVTPTIQTVANYLNYSPTTKHVMSFDSTGGDTLIAYVSSHHEVVMALSDNFNNIWIPLTGPTRQSSGLDLWSEVWYVKNPAVGPGHVLTLTLSAGWPANISMFVVKNSNVADPIDAVSTIADDADAKTLSPTSPRITTIHSNDLLIGFAKSVFDVQWAAGAGFAFQQAASSNYMVAESGAAIAPGRYASTFAINRPSNWQASIVALRPPESPKPGPIALSWQPSTHNVGVANYQVERCAGSDCEDFVQVGQTTDTSFVDTRAAAPGVYRYRVSSVDEAWNNKSRYSDVITISVPPGLSANLANR